MAQEHAHNLHVMESPDSLVSLRRAGKHGEQGGISAFTLQILAVAASWIAMEPGLGAEKIYGMYEMKLDSYNGNLVMFLVTTVPYLALSMPVSLLLRTLHAINVRVSN
jgi:hypothetical protein